jgi:hypothetical protein
MMAYTYFYGYLVLIWVFLLISVRYRQLNSKHVYVGIATIAYSLTYEIILGDWLGLYHYLDKTNSPLYIVLAGILIYPLLNILYVLFLPINTKNLLPYTGAWITVMLLFEYITVIQKIVVMTGWKPIPWSIATYAFTYLWINILYRYLEKRPTCEKV